MPCTIKDVARRAGLSPSTVSRSLNNSGYVNASTRRVWTSVLPWATSRIGMREGCAVSPPI